VVRFVLDGKTYKGEAENSGMYGLEYITKEEYEEWRKIIINRTVYNNVYKT